MSSTAHRNYHVYTLIATATLTASLNDNLRVFPSYGSEHLDLEAFYVPNQSSRTATVFVEYSSDGTNFVPYTTLRDEIGDSDNAINLVSNPLTITGTTGGTTYARKIHIPSLLANIRVSAKESGSSLFGTIQIKGTFS
jgi:hypothetical protein